MAELFYPTYEVQLYPLPTADRPSDTIVRKDDEMLPVVDENGLVFGMARRSYVHSGSKLLHPVVHIHILNHMGEFYLQKRAAGKDSYPGYWDSSVGGHVGFGESVAEALLREAQEELRLSRINPVDLGTYVWEDDSARELVYVFGLIHDALPQPNPEEVSEGRFWSPDEIVSNIGKGIFTPDLENEFLSYREKLEALI